MNILKSCFVFLRLLVLLVQLMSVVSYTVVLKQVKPLYPSVKVYRYELRQPKIWQDSNTQYIYHKPLQSQRLYPVPVKPGRDENYKLRIPAKKENKITKASWSSNNKAVSRDPQVLGLSPHLVPPVLNQITDYSEAKEEETRGEENDIRSLLVSPHAGKSFASFNQEKGKIYKNPGEWATPDPQADLSDSETAENTTEAKFTPSQLYLQIRHKNTVIHVPQSEALKDAETLEELINAPRLKELARTTHVQETYSEEGYEDAGYDHAGHIRQAQHGEVYDAKDEGKFKIKEAPVILDYDSDLEETKRVPLKKEIDLPEGNSTYKLEPRITRSQLEANQAAEKYAKVPKNYKGEHKYSSRIINRKKVTNENNDKFNLEKRPDVQPTFPSYFGEMPSTPEGTVAHAYATVYEPPVKKSSKYRKDNFNSTKIYPVSKSAFSPVKEYTDFNPYISVIDTQASPSTKSLKYSKIYSKKTKHLRLEPLKSEGNLLPPLPPNPDIPPLEDSEPQQINEKTVNEKLINERIVLPTIGYINSLTTAHFGKESPKPLQTNKFKPQSTGSLNLTQALNYLRTNRNQQNHDAPKNLTEIDVRTFEPMKLKKLRSDPRKTKRDVYVTGEREGDDDESDLPHDEKNKEIEENERERIEAENQEKEKYESDLKEEISKQEKKILKETFKNIGIEDDVAEVFPKFSSSNLKSHHSFPVETTTTQINIRKYPFYFSKKLPENSPLRYATDPRKFPKKTGYKMEFYESRDKFFQCPDFHPDLSDLPNSNSSESDDEAKDTPRLADLGSKIACLRMKYFDPEPFDNPIFIEKEIDYVGKNSRKTKKNQNKVTPNQKDLKFEQSNHHKSNASNLDRNERVNFGSDISRLPKPSEAVISHDVKNPFGTFLKVPSTTRPEISQNINKKKIIPIKKVFNGVVSPAPQTFLNKTNSKIQLKTTYRPKPQHYASQKLPGDHDLVEHHNISCLPNISRIASLDGSKNLTIDCGDAIIIQEILNNVAYIKIIPKKDIKRKKAIKKENTFSLRNDQSDWIPIPGYTLPKNSNRSSKPMSRRTDEVTKLVNETNFNDSSNHYVIDELKEDENVRKGEVTEDMDHYLKLMANELKETTTVKTDTKRGNSTRRRRAAENGVIRAKLPRDFAKRLEFSFDKSTDKAGPDETLPKQLQAKRPLKRLSGLDFLIRYHKNKKKLTSQKAEDFWKITSRPPTDEKIIETKKPTPKITGNAEKKLNKPFKETNPKEGYDLRKPSASSGTEKTIKNKSEQINEYRKSTGTASDVEKSKKKPEPKTPKVRKVSGQNITTEKITSVRSHNFTKIITKVSREMSESSEKPRIAYKHITSKSFRNSTADGPDVKSSPENPGEPHYKTINRTSNSFKNNSEELLRRPSENPAEPVLYYIVNLKTGRGKWVTNYDERKNKELKKHQKFNKLKKLR